MEAILEPEILDEYEAAAEETGESTNTESADTEEHSEDKEVENSEPLLDIDTLGIDDGDEEQH